MCVLKLYIDRASRSMLKHVFLEPLARRFPLAAKPPKMDPQHGAMLDLVLGSIFDRFWEVFLDVLGASWGHLGDVLGRLAAQIGAMLALVLGSIFDRFWEVFLDVLGASWGHLGDVLGRLRGRMTGSAFTRYELRGTFHCECSARLAE